MKQYFNDLNLVGFVAASVGSRQPALLTRFVWVKKYSNPDICHSNSVFVEKIYEFMEFDKTCLIVIVAFMTTSVTTRSFLRLKIFLFCFFVLRSVF